MHEHVFVDESKHGGFLLAAVSVQPSDLSGLRSLVNSLRMPRQRRLHFSSESDQRRRQILGAFNDAGVTGQIYDARRCPDSKGARDLAIAQLADDVAAMGAARLILERDDSVVQNDRRIIFERLRKANYELQYHHMRAHEDCLLSLPDALAWCAAKGGIWWRLAEDLVTGVVDLRSRL
jgi:hypothetical protein